ncbi:MAG: 16S rRNA (cytosine(1402)-N(4))-methyltransferase RsmH [Eubacteriaceae bacterium]|nr:16S rRNA (cytosine(1402)-N(4))-methyltransferase RsmH [Eubacteriaceae bacterium]
MDYKHTTVLLDECIQGLNIHSDGTYVDCTLGGGGHSWEICSRLSLDGVLVGIDQDEYALGKAEERLKAFNCSKKYVRDNFENIKKILENLEIQKVDGILMDLGVSSFQLDDGTRGFSYNFDSELDMRMDKRSELSAWVVVNTYSEKEIRNILRDYGEEKFAHKIAYSIVKKREEKSIDTTFELVEIIKSSIPAKFRREGPHPARRTFQAIRIEVNNELGILKKAISDSIESLNPGGRLCMITFHSLEDRIVKRAFKEMENPCQCPSDFPICQCGKKPEIKIITKKPIYPTEVELEKNPRSRSAKLRIAEKL